MDRMNNLSKTQFVLEVGMKEGTISSDGPGPQNWNSFVIYYTKNTSVDVNFVQL